MKLDTTDNSDLMEAQSISPERGNLTIEETIIDAMPVRAVIKPDVVISVFKVMNP